MVNFLYGLSQAMMLASTGDEVVSPLYDGLSMVGPYAITIVGVLSLFYGIFLGVKYAQADTADAKANLQKTLVNFCIGAVTVITLISVLYAIRGPLSRWIDG